MSHPIASAISTSVADTARAAIDEAYCVRIALTECLLSDENTKDKIEEEEDGVGNAIETIEDSDAKVLNKCHS